MTNGLLLNRSIRFLLFYFLIIGALYYAKPFLVPVVFAGLFAMLLLPLSKKFESYGWHRGIAIITCIIILMAILSVIIYLLSWQVSEILKDAEKIEQNISQKLDSVRQFITNLLGISQQQQQEMIQQQQNSGTNKIASMVAGAMSSIGSFLAHFILVLVYIFLFLYFRDRLKNFIMKLVKKEEQQNAREITESCRQVAQKYLSGLAIMIGCLWIMYGIGFTIIGVKNAVFFAILCGLLETVPFVGNLTGSILTALMTLAQGGSTGMFIGVFVVYGIVQFTQTYLLEPLIVGRGVDINPLFTIAGIVAGELIWGIPGMILAIPLLAITKIICDHIEPLKPYGYLIGDSKQGSDVQDRLKKLVKRRSSGK